MSNISQLFISDFFRLPGSGLSAISTATRADATTTPLDKHDHYLWTNLARTGDGCEDWDGGWMAEISA